jgi:hypothetical protein
VPRNPSGDEPGFQTTSPESELTVSAEMVPVDEPIEYLWVVYIYIYLKHVKYI